MSSWIDSVELVELVPVGLGGCSCRRLWIGVAGGVDFLGVGGCAFAIGGEGAYRLNATSKCFAHDVRWSIIIFDFEDSPNWM